MNELTDTDRERGQAIKAARRSKGWSLDDAAFEMRMRLGKASAISKAKLGRFEMGGPITSADALIVAGFYEVPLSTICPEAGAEVDEIIALALAAVAESAPRRGLRTGRLFMEITGTLVGAGVGAQ